MPIGPLPFLDRTAPTFRTDVDRFFLTDLPAWSAQLAGVEANINAKEHSSMQYAQSAGEAAGMAWDSEHAADQHRASAALHDASAQAAAVAAQNGAGLPEVVEGAVLKGQAGGGVKFEKLSPADMGLDKVDNTSDAQKPVSVPQAAALLPKDGGVATRLGDPFKDLGDAAAGANVSIDAAVASVFRVKALGNLSLSFANVPLNVSFSMELLCVNFGGRTISWPPGKWVKTDGSQVPAVGNSGVTWQTAGEDRVMVMFDGGQITYKVMR